MLLIIRSALLHLPKRLQGEVVYNSMRTWHSLHFACQLSCSLAAASHCNFRSVTAK